MNMLDHYYEVWLIKIPTDGREIQGELVIRCDDLEYAKQAVENTQNNLFTDRFTYDQIGIKEFIFGKGEYISMEPLRPVGKKEFYF